MRGTERIVHIHIAQRGELLRELRIVLFFLGVESQILQQHHLARFRAHRLHFGTNAVGGHFHGPSEQFFQSLRHRLQAHLRIRLALRAAEVAREHDAGALFKSVLNCWQRRLDPLVACDLLPARRKGNIEVDANEDNLVFEVQITDG